MKTYEEWKVLAKKIDFPNTAYINGRKVDAFSGDTFDCISPLDGRVLTKVASCDKADIDIAVKCARDSFNRGDWSEASPQHRKKILLIFADLIHDNADELALLDTLDMGKPVKLSRGDDLPSVVNSVRWYAESLDKVYGEVAPSDMSFLGLVLRQPIGVVGCIVPWNFPLDLAALKFAPALAAGNSIILKPAEQSPLSALKIAELASEAGIPDGVFNVIPGFGITAGQALGLHMDVNMISFTGSTKIGKLFMKYSADSNMKKVSLECGGKSPNIVFADVADLDAASDGSVGGMFYNGGQFCLAASRLLVQQEIYDEFMEKIVERVKNIKVGDPLDPETEIGTMVDETHTKRVMEFIQTGRQEGAETICGGDQIMIEESTCYIAPTIFSGVDENMEIAQEEIFGPVLAVIPFNNADEALRIANNSIYGLSASIWTDNLNLGQTLARHIDAGTVTINTMKKYDISFPFGGLKQSGIGRDCSLHGLKKYTELKTINMAITNS